LGPPSSQRWKCFGVLSRRWSMSGSVWKKMWFCHSNNLRTRNSPLTWGEIPMDLAHLSIVGHDCPTNIQWYISKVYSIVKCSIA
jgi:hypothetical protein